MGTSRLLIYNNALRICGERSLATISENREPRRLLDDVWSGGAIDYCLEEGQWNFAMRTSQIDYDTSVSPPFGHPYAFTKPEDWIRTAGLCSDELFKSPLLEYRDEAGYWYASLTTIYVRYVSNDSAYGNDLGRWPGTFSSYVDAYFASEIITKLTQDKDRLALVTRELKKRKKDALNKDAMNDPTAIPAPGSWVRARFGGGRRDGGNRGSLIG